MNIRFAAALILAASPALAEDDASQWRFDVEASYSDLTKNMDAWREGALRAAYRVDSNTWIAGSAETSERFNKFDAYLEARIDRQFAPGTTAYAFAGGTPDADFRPEVALGAGGTARLFKDGDAIEALVATLDLSYADYAAGDIETLNPGFEIYAFQGRAWATAKAINLWDETGRHRSGYLLRLDVSPAEDYRIYAGHADAPETSEGITLDTQSWFAGVSVPVAGTTTIKLSGAKELRDSAYDRTTVSLALSFRM